LDDDYDWDSDWQEQKKQQGFLICLEKKDILKINYKTEVSFARQNGGTFNE